MKSDSLKQKCGNIKAEVHLDMEPFSSAFPEVNNNSGLQTNRELLAGSAFQRAIIWIQGRSFSTL